MGIYGYNFNLFLVFIPCSLLFPLKNTWVFMGIKTLLFSHTHGYKFTIFAILNPWFTRNHGCLWVF